MGFNHSVPPWVRVLDPYRGSSSSLFYDAALCEPPEGAYSRRWPPRDALRRGSGWDWSASITDPALIPNLDQVNPPLNVTADIEGTRLSIQWDKPVSAFPPHCFDYEVKIYNARKGYFQVILQIVPVFDDSILFEIFLKLPSVSAPVTAWHEGGQR